MHRSALYVPADNSRAMAKAGLLDADMLIFDLEDGVAPEKKDGARGAVEEKLLGPHPNPLPEGEGTHPNLSLWERSESRERLRVRATKRLVRINHRSTPHYAEDLAAIAALPVDGIMLSKVSSAEDVSHACAALAAYDRADVPIWCNVETPLGIANAMQIAAHPAVRGLVAGTNDLANDLRVVRTPDRAGLLHSLQHLLLAGRAHGRIVLDGTFIHIQDLSGLRTEAQHGKMLGFDGKTLVHPSQIAPVHEVYAPSDAEKAQAQAIVSAYEAAMNEGKAVIVVNGQMVEKLHYDRAVSMLADA